MFLNVSKDGDGWTRKGREFQIIMGAAILNVLDPILVVT